MSGGLIYILAGEPSGDLLGSHLMEAIYARDPEAQIIGLGGPRMRGSGLNSLFPYDELSLIGFAEVLPHARHIMRRMREMEADIAEKQPAVFISIDVPGFALRLARRLRANPRTKHIKLVHYVAPTVWAYNPKRAETMAALYDHLLCLLPFEPEWFTPHGLKASFIGHPVVAEAPPLPDAKSFRNHHGILESQPVLALLPGSRKGELQRHLPIYGKMVQQLSGHFHGLTMLVIVPEAQHAFAKSHTDTWPGRVLLVDPRHKLEAFAASTAALAKSGTVTLELANAGVPMVVTYKLNPLSAWMLRRVIRVRFVTLINLLLDREVIPEMIQEKCEPRLLAERVARLLANPQARQQQLEDSERALAMLKPLGETPSARAAEIILKYTRRTD